MGFLELLTIAFIILQVTRVITWSWWLVFLPAIIAGVIYLIWFLIATVFVGSTHIKVMKQFDKDFWKK